MVMCFGVGNLERDRDLWKEGLERERFEIAPGVEPQAIDPGRRRAGVRHQRALSAVGVGFSTANELPFRFVLPLEHDTNPGRGDAAGGIEDVGSDRAHEGSILAH